MVCKYTNDVILKKFLSGWMNFFFFCPTESWEASSQLTFFSPTLNTRLEKWASKATITSCFTWLTTWPFACCQPLKTPPPASLTPGSVTVLWLQVVCFHPGEVTWLDARQLYLEHRWTWRLASLLTASTRPVLLELDPCWWSLGFWAAWLAIPPLSGWPDVLSERCGTWGATKPVC